MKVSFGIRERAIKQLTEEINQYPGLVDIDRTRVTCIVDGMDDWSLRLADNTNTPVREVYIETNMGKNVYDGIKEHLQSTCSPAHPKVLPVDPLIVHARARVRQERGTDIDNPGLYGLPDLTQEVLSPEEAARLEVKEKCEQASQLLKVKAENAGRRGVPASQPWLTVEDITGTYNEVWGNP